MIIICSRLTKFYDFPLNQCLFGLMCMLIQQTHHSCRTHFLGERPVHLDTLCRFLYPAPWQLLHQLILDMQP